MAKKRRRPPGDGEEGGHVDVENHENHSYEDIEEEDEEEGGHDRRGKKKKKKKKTKFQIMSSSGQTEAERRIIRCRQRKLKEDIAMGAASGDSGELMQFRDQNNELWEDVRHTREAVLDSENVDLIANKASRQAEKIVQVPRYDAVKMAQNLHKKGTVRQGASSEFNWHGLGFQVGVCFNALPSHASFLFGPLDAKYTPKERKKTERRQKTPEEAESENEEEEQPEDVNQNGKAKESTGNELSAVERHISVIKQTLRKRSAVRNATAIKKAEDYESQLSQEIGDESVVQKKTKKFVIENSSVNAVNMLFNPQSFTQTVENMFHFSFLVKQGKASIKARSADDVEEFGGEPGPAIRAMDNHDMGTPKQAIVALNMKDWKDMCKAYSVEESDVPHREHGKVAFKKEKKERKSN